MLFEFNIYWVKLHKINFHWRITMSVNIFPLEVFVFYSPVYCVLYIAGLTDPDWSWLSYYLTVVLKDESRMHLSHKLLSIPHQGGGRGQVCFWPAPIPLLRPRKIWLRGGGGGQIEKFSEKKQRLISILTKIC